MQTRVKKIKIIVILGPTASGKTSLGVELAKKFNAEIISADSRQVYLGMDLGTGKEGEKAILDLPNLGPTPARLIDGIPQYLVDIISPNKTYTVADFLSDADALIKNITNRQKLPIIVGGTNLYIQALLEGYALPPADEKENALRNELEKLSKEEILAKLQTIDPVSYEKIDHQNTRRLIRALSATISSGTPFSELQLKKETPYEILYLGITLPREKLYKKIDLRVDSRIKEGMIEEVQSLLDQGVPSQKLISFGLEYRYITKFLLGEIKTKSEMTQFLKFAIHAFARRQLTWINNKLPVIWIKNIQEAEGKISNFLEK